MIFRRIKDLREDNDYKQRDVFNYIRCCETTYRKYEHGTWEIPSDKLIKLAELYNVSLDYLTERAQDKGCFRSPQYTVPQMLFSLRREHHKSQEDISNFLQCVRSMYSEYEEGAVRISVSMLMKLADFYEVSLDYMCGCF